MNLVATHTPLELCDQGDYKAAADLAGLRVGQWPENVSGDRLTRAETLLVAGIITSVEGGIQQTADQSTARGCLPLHSHVSGKGDFRRGRFRRHRRLGENGSNVGVNAESWGAQRDLTERLEAQAKIFDPALIGKMRSAQRALDSALIEIDRMESERELIAV